MVPGSDPKDGRIKWPREGVIYPVGRGGGGRVWAHNTVGLWGLERIARL